MTDKYHNHRDNQRFRKLIHLIDFRYNFSSFYFKQNKI